MGCTHMATHQAPRCLVKRRGAGTRSIVSCARRGMFLRYPDNRRSFRPQAAHHSSNNRRGVLTSSCPPSYVAPLLAQPIKPIDRLQLLRTTPAAIHRHLKVHSIWGRSLTGKEDQYPTALLRQLLRFAQRRRKRTLMHAAHRPHQGNDTHDCVCGNLAQTNRLPHRQHE